MRRICEKRGGQDADFIGSVTTNQLDKFENSYRRRSFWINNHPDLASSLFKLNDDTIPAGILTHDLYW